MTSSFPAGTPVHLDTELAGRIALIRGSGLADAEIEFLTASRRAMRLHPVGPEGCEVPVWLRAAGRLIGARGAFALMRLGEEGRAAIAGCGAAWIPDPWIALSGDVARLALARQVPYVVTVWENLVRHPSVLVPTLRRRAARVLRDARLIHCVSQRSVEYVGALDPALDAPIVQVFPGVDLQRFTPQPSLRPESCYRFLFVGRLVAEKGLPELLQAFRRLTAGRSDVELWIAGAGSLEAMARRAAEQLRQVRFLGFVPRRRLPEVLRACHTLVLPSRTRRLGPLPLWEEQFGFVLVEAMAAGLDVIASRSGSIPEVVGDVGCLIGTTRLAAALEAAMGDAVETAAEWQSRSEAARAAAASRFDARRNAESLITAVEAALA